jgi:hypothetical protein
MHEIDCSAGGCSAHDLTWIEEQEEEERENKKK